MPSLVSLVGPTRTTSPTRRCPRRRFGGGARPVRHGPVRGRRVASSSSRLIPQPIDDGPEAGRDLRERPSATDGADTVIDPDGELCSWQRLFEALPCGIGLIDARGVIRYVNERLEAISAYTRDQLVGQAVEVLVPSRRRECHVAKRSRFTDRPVARPHGTGLNLVLVRSDQREIPVDVAIAPLVIDGEHRIVAMVRDDSARAAAEQAHAEVERNAAMAAAAASEELAGSERRFRLAFENNTAGMAIADLDGRLVEVNRSYCEMLGYAPEELLGRDLSEVTHPEDRSLTGEMNRRLASGGVDRVRYVKRYVHNDGRVLHAEISTGVITDGAGVPVSLVASVKDVTEERSLLSQLTHQALHDPLTGLANRALFEDRLSQVRERADRLDGWNAVFLLDLDDFKAVNDTLGHHVGDELLVELARRLEKVTRSSDTLCRFGGDEFLYLAEGLRSSADEVADRLLGVLGEPFLLSGVRLEQGASLGVVVYEASGRDRNELLRDADTALYEAKRQGKGRYVLFTPEMRDRTSSRFELARELRRALPSGELAMAYQPLVDLATEEVVGFEALMRWQHPRRGPVPPDEFIPLAEQSDLIIELGSFALTDASAVAASWQQGAGATRPPYVSVNLSARQFHDPDLPATIDGALSASGLPASCLVLEITESVALSDLPTASRVFEYLGERGVAVALDDFGTGYSSLSYLARLRPAIIKIDRSFVSPPQETSYDNALLEAIISLGHKLDLTVLAEGIETRAQLEHLRALGCHLGQGYFFSAAVPSAEAAQMIGARGCSMARP